MPVLRPRSVLVSLVSLFVLSAGCGDDKGGGEGSSSGATPATEASASEASASEASATAASATDSATSEPTGDPTADPTAAPDGMYCVDECSGDADCKEQGMDFGFKCVDKRCTVEASGGGCADDFDCQVQLSGWSTVCAAQADCSGGVCVDIGGEGRCALAPSDVVMCAVFSQVEVSIPRFPEGDDVTVCSNTDYECSADGVCTDPCTADADCTQFTGYPKCNLGTGVCECGGDDDCALLNAPAQSVCHAGFCGCGSDGDCAGVNSDVCNPGGLCGCSSASACTQPGFDGTTQVCTAL